MNFIAVLLGLVFAFLIMTVLILVLLVWILRNLPLVTTPDNMHYIVSESDIPLYPEMVVYAAIRAKNNKSKTNRLTILHEYLNTDKNDLKVIQESIKQSFSSLSKTEIDSIVRGYIRF